MLHRQTMEGLLQDFFLVFELHLEGIQKKKGVHGGSWTAQFFGLSSKDQEKHQQPVKKKF